jgi:hypothetical protein
MDEQAAPIGAGDLSRRLRVAEIPESFFVDFLFRKQENVAIQCVFGVPPNARLVDARFLRDQHVILLYFAHPDWPEVPDDEESAVPQLQIGLQPVELVDAPREARGPGGKLILPAGKRTKSA